VSRGALALAVAATTTLASCGGSTPLPQPVADAAAPDDLAGPDLSHHTCYGAPPARPA
jgi:hypothetical protein